MNDNDDNDEAVRGVNKTALSSSCSCWLCIFDQILPRLLWRWRVVLRRIQGLNHVQVLVLDIQVLAHKVKYAIVLAC